MNVYILTGEGVCATPIVGVYSTKALATAAAEEAWPQTDGYHDFVITEYEVDPELSLGYPLCRTSIVSAPRAPRAKLELEYR
jgi:hypothetical protein